MTGQYALDNQHQAAGEHHRALAALLDPHTRARVEQLPQWPGMRQALDVGAGGGSMARWLAGRLPHVVAADHDPAWLTGHERVTAVAVDLVADEHRLAARLGTGHDLVLARMTLQHIPSRERLVPALADLLAPGGVLLVEDWHVRPPEQQHIAHAPSAADRELMVAYRRAVAAVFDRAGVDRMWARRSWQMMLQAGLGEVDTRFHGEFWAGGSPGMTLMGTTAAQLRPRLLDAGMTGEQLDRVAALAHDPALVVEGHPLYSTSGVRPM